MRIAPFPSWLMNKHPIRPGAAHVRWFAGPRLTRRRLMLAASGVGLAVACGDTEPRFDFARLLAVAPLTGPEATTGRDVADGVRLAVEEWNLQPAARALPVELVVADHADPERVARLAGDPRLLVAVGLWTPPFATQPATAAGAPAAITLTATAGGPALPGDIELAPPARLVAETTAAAVAFQFGAGDIALVVSGTVAAREQARLFLEAAPARGLTIRASLYLRSIETGYAALVAPLRAGSPRAVVALGHGYDAGSLWAELRPRDARIPLFLGVGGLDDSFRRLAGGFFEGVLGLALTPQPREVEAATRLVTVFGARFGRAPTVAAAHAYDAALLGLQAVRRAGGGVRRPARAEVRSALRATAEFAGPFRAYRLANGVPASWPLAFYRLERDGTPLLVGEPAI